MSLLSATGLRYCTSLTSRRSHGSPCNWKTSTHSPFSYILRFAMCARFYIRVCRTKIPSLTFFASQCVLGSTLGYAVPKSPKGPLNAYFRMILFKVPLVIPTHVLWLAMLFVVGILGLIGQVCHPVLVPLPYCLTQIFSTYEDTFNDGSST